MKFFLKAAFKKGMDRPLVPVYGLYFVCCMGTYQQIVREQMETARQSGLLKRTRKLVCFICMYKPEIMELIQPYMGDTDIEIIKTAENLYERYALENFRAHVPMGDDFYLYYFHSKGVSRDPRRMPVMHERRKNLDFYVLQKYAVCIHWLEHGYDAVGASLSLYPTLHFSGNFWWTTSRHLDRLPKSTRPTYLGPEMYICSIPDAKYISVCQTTNSGRVRRYQLLTDAQIIEQSTPEPIAIRSHKSIAY